MTVASNERIHFRVSKKERQTLDSIQASGQFPDTSSTVRFCIQFTKTILSIIPAAIGESLVESMEEDEYDIH